MRSSTSLCVLVLGLALLAGSADAGAAKAKVSPRPPSTPLSFVGTSEGGASIEDGGEFDGQFSTGKFVAASISVNSVFPIRTVSVSVGAEVWSGRGLLALEG